MKIGPPVPEKKIFEEFLPYDMKFTVQEFLLHRDLLGVPIFHIMEKRLFIVQMIKSMVNNVCMRGQDRMNLGMVDSSRSCVPTSSSTNPFRFPRPDKVRFNTIAGPSPCI